MAFKNRPAAAVFAVILAMITGCGGLTAGKENIEAGMDAVEAQDYDLALTCFEKAREEGEDGRQLYRGMGIAYMGNGSYTEAERSFEKALSFSNGLVKKIDYDINYYLAMAQYKAGEIDEAIKTYDAILAMDEKSADGHYLRGRVRLLKNDREGAVEDYDRALEIKPSDYDLYINIFESLKAAGYDSDARSYLDRALERKDKMTEYQSGVFAYYMGKYDDARSLLESVRTKNDSEELILYLGKTYDALGDMNYASSLYTEYIGKNGPCASICNELGLVDIKKQEYSAALEMFEKGKELNDPAYTQSIMFNEIVAYEYLLDFKKAAVLMEEYLEKYPEDETAQREYIFLSTR